MNDNARRPGPDPGGDHSTDGPGGRLAAYEARTQTPLDLLALLTLWIVLVPPWDFSSEGVWWAVRTALSVVYGIDLAIRGVLARRPVRYALGHPLALAAVIFPPVRLIFSVRLVRSIFRRGNLVRFLIAAAVLVANCAAMVYLFERHASGSDIHTLGESVWWAVVTVATVGYGDYVPVTAPGRVTACFIMAIGLLTLAVVTAQTASSFVAQGTSRNRRSPQVEAAPPEMTLAELDRRLARIEALLVAAAPSPPRAAKAPEQDPGST